MQAYCFKCRGKHDLLNPTPIFFTNGSPALQGTCANCGYEKVYKMGRTPEHDGVTPPSAEQISAARARKADSPNTAGPNAKKAKASVKKAGKSEAKGGADKQSAGGRGGPLVIVESPTKARTIGKFLGRKFTVRASIGHVRDLPKNRLGVDVDHDFEPTYVVPVKKKDTVKELRQLAKHADSIWLATDPDREGEAISWHLRSALAGEIVGKPVQRVEFHEITQDAIQHAFAHPRQIDENAVNAQQARRILDRLVGYKLSPLVSDKLNMRGLSAGRVQSVAVRLVVEREREIQAFVPVEYWSIEAELTRRAGSPPFTARLHKLRGQDPDLHSQADAVAVVSALDGAQWRVVKVETKERQRRPAAPFTTSTLQQEASRKLGFNARRTMGAAQSLYEGVDVGEGATGLITYMRTDSTNVAESAQREARQFIGERLGQEFMPDAAPIYKSRAKNAQEAHEAVRPTSVFRTPEQMRAFLDADQFRLYDLIWKRFVASQMSNAVFDATTVDIDAAVGPKSAQPLSVFWFRASGSVQKFSGFLRVYEESRDEGDAAPGDGDDAAGGSDRRLPALAANDALDLRRLLPEQHFTQPPPRYTEASLVKALEEYGIGRPSTYASIMTTIQARNYVRRQGRQLSPTELGMNANDLLVRNFGRYIDVGFTAYVEEELDEIESGAREWRPVLHEFYDPFRQAVAAAADGIEKVERKVEPVGEDCPDCGAPLVYKQGRFGKFIGCSNFPTCKHVEPLSIPGVACPKCGGKLAEKRAKKGGRVFYGCVRYPDCDFTTWSRPLALPAPDGSRGLVVLAGKGRAKVLGTEFEFDLPEGFEP
jgi:DNA topoisomerase-1